MIADGRWVYGIGDAIQVFDLQNPAAPRRVGCGFPRPGQRCQAPALVGGAIAMCGDYSSAVNLMWPQCLSPVAVPGDPLPSRIATLDAAPNPFNPRTTIRFGLSAAGRVRLTVYDIAGRRVRTLVDAILPSGTHEAIWDGRDAGGRAAASGSYFARLEAGDTVQALRMSLVR